MDTQPEPRNAVRLLVLLANTALGIALLAAVIWAGLKIGHALLIFSLGILLAYALEPLVARLRTWTGDRLPQGLAVFVVFFVLAVLVGLVIVAAAGPTGRQIREIEARAPELQVRAQALGVGADQWLAQHHIAFQVSSASQELGQFFHSRGEALAHDALNAAGRIAGDLVDLVLVVLVGIYFLIYSPELKQRMSQHIPAIYQQHFQGLRRDMNQILGGFIRGQLVMAAVMGLSAAFGCMLLRLPFWILIGLFVTVSSLIPVVGAYLGAVPAVILALLDPVSPLAKLIWVIALFVVVNEAGSKILYPRLVGSATGLHEVLVLFVLIAGAEVGGIMGALLAVPVTALIGLVAVYAYRVWHQEPSLAPERQQPAIKTLEPQPEPAAPEERALAHGSK